MATPDIFSDIFNASPIGIAAEDLEGQFLFVNPALCSILGFSVEELRGKHCFDFSPPEDAEKDWVLFKQLRAGSIDHYQLEKRCFRRDGSLMWGRWSLSLLISRPSPLVIVMVEDITKKKLGEDYQYKHGAIIESSEDAIISKDREAVITSWNPAAQPLFGYADAEAIGQPITILIPPELIEEENRILDKLRVGERIEHFETIRVTKAGNRVNVSLTISPIRDSTGKIVGFSKIVRDITERKRAEETLRCSEERLRLALRGARLGAFEREVRTGRITWSEGLESLYGLSPGGLDGKTTAYFKELIHPTDYEHALRLLEDALNTGQPTEGEWRALWPDGSVHWISRTLAGLDGRQRRTVASCWREFGYHRAEAGRRGAFGNEPHVRSAGFITAITGGIAQSVR